MYCRFGDIANRIEQSKQAKQWFSNLKCKWPFTFTRAAKQVRSGNIKYMLARSARARRHVRNPCRVAPTCERDVQPVCKAIRLARRARVIVLFCCTPFAMLMNGWFASDSCLIGGCVCVFMCCRVHGRMSGGSVRNGKTARWGRIERSDRMCLLDVQNAFEHSDEEQSYIMCIYLLWFSPELVSVELLHISWIHPKKQQ